MIVKYLINAAVAVVLIIGIFGICKHVNWKHELFDLMNLFRKDA